MSKLSSKELKDLKLTQKEFDDTIKILKTDKAIEKWKVNRIKLLSMSKKEKEEAISKVAIKVLGYDPKKKLDKIQKRLKILKSKKV